MHVGMVTQDFPPDARGAGYYAYYLSQELCDRGHDVTVFTRGDWSGTEQTTVDGIDVYRVRFAPTYPCHLQVHGMFLNRIVSRHEDELDVLHLHNPAVPRVRTALPTILTAHGTAKEGIEQRANDDAFSMLLNALAPLFVRNERKLLSDVDQATAVSNACAAELREYYGVENVIRLPNGVNTDYFSPTPGRDPLVLYTGALDARKGLFDLLEAAKIVCESEPDARFVLTGRGRLASKLQAKADELGLTEQVMFPGYVDRDELLEYYRRASVYINPSYYEGLPTGVLEAMACGLPVVATDVRGNSELVTPGKNGLLVPAKEPQELAAATLTILNDPTKQRRFAANARTLTEDRYDWRVIGQQAEKLYANVVSNA